MITGVTEGYQKGLEIIGVGYNFKVQGSTLTIKAFVIKEFIVP